MAKRILPRVHVLVLCDDLEDRFEDVAAFNLTGVRTHIVAPAFPYRHPQLYVYLQVTAHPRMARCRGVLLRAETDEELFISPETMVPLSGPLDFYHVHFLFPDCEFPGARVYYVQVYFDGVICAERALILLEPEAGGNGQTS